MLSKKLEKALNNQLNLELYSAYVYFSMSAYFESISLTGFAAWMRAQAQEELMHMMKFYTFINDLDGRVIMDAVNKPPMEWKSALHAIEDTLKHEQAVTKAIHNIVDLANKENNHSVNTFLQWFISEQVEEEASTRDLVEKLKMIKDAPGGLFFMDKELGGRTAPNAAE